MTLAEFKQHIDAFYEMHPLAKVDFTYPTRYRGERRTKLGDATGFDLHFTGTAAYLRIRLEHTGDHMKEAPDDACRAIRLLTKEEAQEWLALM